MSLSVPPDGGPSPHPIDIVADAHNVYWVTFDGGDVLSEPIAGGVPPFVIASGEDHPHAIAVDDTNVYWTDLGTALSGTGSVKQAPKNARATPATLVTLSQNEKAPWDVAVDGTSVYWTDRANPGSQEGPHRGDGSGRQPRPDAGSTLRDRGGCHVRVLDELR
ncbi:MAG: hypothetical protein M3O36_05040 [Myxococcota bacterium]|nr:hypothetical protein [Myxococcota bacterium]